MSFSIIAPRSWRLFLYLYLLGILFMSLQPDYPRPGEPGWIPDVKNFLHIPAYFGLTFLLLGTLGRLRWRTRISAFVIAVGYGAVNEIVQAFVPGRSCSLDDVGRNAVGALVAIGLFWKVNPVEFSLSALNWLKRRMPRA